MQHRNLRDDALEDSAASLRMANGILRELVEAGAVDCDPDDLAVTRDGIAGTSMELADPDPNAQFESSPDPFRDCGIHDTAEAARVLRLTERRLEALARLIDGAADEPFIIE